MKKIRLIPVIALATAVSGCAVTPDRRPELPTPAKAFRETTASLVAGEEPEAAWWSRFNDPVLDDLLRRAAEGNRDLRMAEARLQEALALRRGSRWAFAPQGGVTAGYDRRQPGWTESPAGVRAPPASTWSAGFDAAWELDLFGRLRHAARAADADAGTAESQLRAVRVSLLAEIASGYFSLQGARSSADLLRRQRDLLEHALQTTRHRVDAGMSGPLEIARAEELLKQTEAMLPLAEREEAEQRNRIAVLLGESPTDFDVVTPSTDTTPDTHAIMIGRPADLLRRRPDVAAAEQQLAAAAARAKVRTAELFPEVSIRGMLRLIGGDGVRLGSAGSAAWSVAPSASWNILNLGTLNALRHASRFQAEAAIAHYEQTVLRALEDMENALARYRAADERIQRLNERGAAAERGLRIAGEQYEAGAIGALERIDAARVALAASRETVAALAEHRLAVVAVYKALGGGWADADLWAGAHQN